MTARAAFILPAIAAVAATATLAAPACAAEPLPVLLDVLVAAHPQHLAGHDGANLIWKDGTRMPASDADGAKSFAALLQRPSIADQFAIPYPLGRAPSPPGTNEDPGRIRNENFFIKMYGDCRRGAVAPALVSTRWVAGTTLSATRINGVAGRLAAVARALEALPGDLAKFLAPPAGAYHCRAIAGTGRLSAHAFGAAIDVNARYGDYWRWSMAAGAAPAWKNRVPAQIVEMFERHGFIWGGRWYHYDTFHFEYRPELVALAKRVATQP